MKIKRKEIDKMGKCHGLSKLNAGRWTYGV
jgi:hypothetical protein